MFICYELLGRILCSTVVDTVISEITDRRVVLEINQ
jgi:hypothetical protein